MGDLLDKFDECLEDAFTESIRSTGSGENLMQSFDIASFVRVFRKNWAYCRNTPPALNTGPTSGSFTFLFHKNSAVTDICIAELIALLRRHTRKGDNSETSLHFFNSSEYSSYVLNLWSRVFVPTPGETLKKSFSKAKEAFKTHFFRALEEAVIVDKLFTSCTVHIPLSLCSDIEHITYSSGYVFSSGPTIYNRNIDKAHQDDLEASLDRFLKVTGEEKFFVTPYAEEFFGPFEKNVSRYSVRNGLDGIRLRMRKHHIGAGVGANSITLMNSLQNLAGQFPERLSIAKGERSYFDERNSSVTGVGSCSKDCTIFLFVDRDAVELEDGSQEVGSNRVFLIVQAQYYKNSNPLLLLKERKPGWYAPVTIPHTLSSAMINLVHVDSAKPDPIHAPLVLDPFCGTGTFLMDYFLRSAGACKLVGLDRNQSVPQIAQDNLLFFGDVKSNYRKVNQYIAVFAPRLGDGRRTQDLTSFFGSYSTTEAEADVETDAMRIFRLALKQWQNGDGDAVLERGFDGEAIAWIKKAPLEQRLFFYLSFRAIFNARHLLVSDAPVESFFKAVAKEFSDVDIEKNEILEDALREPLLSFGRFNRVQGLYSATGILDQKSLSEAARDAKILPSKELLEKIDSPALFQNGFTFSAVEDSVELLSKFNRCVDVLITDPPYNVNVAEPTADLLPQMANLMLDAISVGGQIIMALPSFSKDGKRVAFDSTSDFLVRHFINCADRKKRRVVNVARLMPETPRKIRPPYYWLSGSGVSRNIIHFVIQ